MSNPTLFGYLERPYLSDAYLTEFAEMAYGMQTTMVIAAAKDVAMQATMDIASTKSVGMQSEQTINATKAYGSQANMFLGNNPSYGMQTETNIAVLKSIGMQSDMVVTPESAYAEQIEATINALLAKGYQVEQTIADGSQAKGSNVIITNIAHWCVGYLVRPYLVDPYLTCLEQAQGGYQVEITINAFKNVGMQVILAPTSYTNVAEQAKLVIQAVDAIAEQVEQTIANHPDAIAEQVERIINAVKPYGMQAKLVIDATRAFGMQVDQIKAVSYGFQTTLVLYNTDKIRILSSFPSRGLDGLNWTANSTATGDFSANNLNTDIVEQQWRSAPSVVGGLILKCDMQGPIVFNDTMAILNHNLTTSATVVVQGFSDPGYSVQVVTFPITVLKKNANAYYIAPTLPTSGARYWQINIDDPTNPDGQIKIGTIIFGASDIFSGDNITNEVTRSMVHFADKIATEGFTDVMNDRALKFAVKVEFQNLLYTKGNYQTLDELFQFARTSLKTLWIPDPRIPERFAVFGKLKQIPDSVHNVMASDSDYVSITAEVDESL